MLDCGRLPTSMSKTNFQFGEPLQHSTKQHGDNCSCRLCWHTWWQKYKRNYYITDKRRNIFDCGSCECVCVCVCVCVRCSVVWCGVCVCVCVCALHLLVKHQILGQVTVTFALFGLTDTDIKTNTVFDLVILQAKRFRYKCTRQVLVSSLLLPLCSISIIVFYF